MAIVFDQVHEASEAVHGFVTERVVQGVRQVLGRSVDSDMPPYLLDDDEEEKKQEKRSSVSERVSPPLDSCPLSFFDDFRAVSGIPSFVLNQKVTESTGNSNVNKSTTSLPQLQKTADSGIMVTVCTFSACTTRLVSGHKNGTLRLWDAEHGILLEELQEFHCSAIADVTFWDSSDSCVLSISIFGVVHFWRIGRNTTYTAREIHSKDDASICTRFSFSNSGTILVCSGFDEMNAIASATIYSFSNLAENLDKCSQVFQCGEVFCGRLGRTVLATDFNNGVLSCVKVSPDKAKIIVCIASNENDRARGVSYLCSIVDKKGSEDPVIELMGEMGEWDLNCDLIVTWDQIHRCEFKREDPASPAWVWSLRDEGVERTTIKDPDFGHIIWCKFYQQESEESSQWHRPSLATCATGDDKDLRIVLWNSYYLTPTSSKLSFVPVHTMPSGIGAFIGACPMVSGYLARRKWTGDVAVKGMNCVAATEKGCWLGAVSGDSKKGVIWNPSHGVTAIEMDFPSVWIKKENSGEHPTHCDLVFPEVGEKRFAVVWDTTIAIMNPRVLGENDVPGAQVLGLKYKDPKVDDSDPSPICKFSSDSESIGLLYPGSDLLNVWDLSKGIRHTVAAGDEHKQFTDFALINQKQGRILVATVSVDKKVVLWSINCLNKPTKKVLYALSSNHRYPSRAISFVSDMPLLAVCEREGSITPERLVYVPLDSKPSEGSCFRGSQIWGVRGRLRKPSKITLGSRAGSPSPQPEDPGLNRVSSIPFSESIQAEHGCWFPSSGETAIFMPRQDELVLWDLKGQKKLKSIKYNIDLDSLGCPFPNNISENGDFAIGMVGTQPTPIRCDPDTQVADLPSVVSSNRTKMTLSERTGSAVESHWVAISDVVPKGSLPRAGNAVNQIRLVDLNGKSRTKVVKGPQLDASKVLVISPDGRRVACLADWRKLRVWSAYACEGLLPDYYSLKDDNKSEDLILVQKMLADFGPVLLNLQSYSFVTRAISDMNMRVLSILMAWALKHGHMIQLRKFRNVRDFMGEQGDCCDGFYCSESWNALDIAMQHRSPESLEQIFSVILRGLVPGFEKARIFEESLVKVGEVYPKVLQRCLHDEKIFVDVCSLEVKESVFKKYGYQVVYDPRLTAPRSMMQAHWDKYTKSAEGVKIPAVLQSIPYGNAAHARTRGLIKRLLMANVPKGAYSSPPIRMVLSYKWNEYGKMMTITQFAHFFLLLMCFTTYCFLLGSTSGTLSDARDPGGIPESHGRSARVFLSLSAILALVSLLCEVKQIVVQVSEDGYRGALHYFSSMWNWVEMAAYIMLVLLIPLFHMVHNVGHSIVVAITSIMLWWKLMYFAKTYRKTGPLVIVLEKILQDIAFFLILGLMVVFGFGVAFFVLYRHVRNDPEIQKLRATGNLGADADIVENILLAFGSVGRTLLTMLTYMLGDFDLDPIHYLHMPGRLSALSQGKTLRNATILVLILYVFSISILLLNLLIAIMADSFQRMKDTEEPEFFHARALAIDDLESMISEKKKNTICSRPSDKGPEYIHILRPLSHYNDATSGWMDRYLYNEDDIGGSEVKDIQKIISLVDKQGFMRDKKGGKVQHSALLPDFSLLLADCKDEAQEPPSLPVQAPEKALDDYYKSYLDR